MGADIKLINWLRGVHIFEDYETTVDKDSLSN